MSQPQLSAIVQNLLDQMEPFEFGDVESERMLQESGLFVEDRPKGVVVDDGIYTGQWLRNNNMRHGRGTLITRDGAYITGYWYQDQLHGEGMHIDTDGTVYIGMWRKGQKHGSGKISKPNGELYSGQFKAGQYHGQGT